MTAAAMPTDRPNAGTIVLIVACVWLAARAVAAIDDALHARHAIATGTDRPAR